MNVRSAIGWVTRIAKRLVVALLMLELVLVYGLGSALSGALGEADDAQGAILLVGPLSVAASLVVIWRLSERASSWMLAVAVFSAPFWASIIFGPASQYNLRPFWAEAFVVVAWPVWGLLGFQCVARAVNSGGRLGGVG
jgi:hypothetical protein